MRGTEFPFDIIFILLHVALIAFESKLIWFKLKVNSLNENNEIATPNTLNVIN